MEAWEVVQHPGLRWVLRSRCVWVKATGEFCLEPGAYQVGGQTVGVRLCNEHRDKVLSDARAEVLDEVRRERGVVGPPVEPLVYLAAAHHPEHGPLVKIGRSVDCQSRVRSLGAILVHTVKGSESVLHSLLGEYRVVGEWFLPYPVARHFKISLPLEPWPVLPVRLS